MLYGYGILYIIFVLAKTNILHKPGLLYKHKNACTHVRSIETFSRSKIVNFKGNMLIQ